MEQFAPADAPIPRIHVIPPAIDPCSPKNLHLPDETARRVLEWMGVRTDRPLVTQVSRFDPWKDPLGVLNHALAEAKARRPCPPRGRGGGAPRRGPSGFGRS